jgi:hypothetical protein
MLRSGLVLGAFSVAGLCLPAARAQVTLSAGVTRAFAGTAVNVPLTLRSRSGPIALQGDLMHEPGVLTTGDVLPGLPSSPTVVMSSAPQPGLRRVLFYSSTGAALSNGTVALFPFFIPANTHSGFYRLTLTNVLVATSSATSLVSTNLPGSIALNPVFVRVDGSVDLVLTVEQDRAYLVQASTNLIDWLTLSTNLSVGPYLEHNDADAAAAPQRFYRAVAVPP